MKEFAERLQEIQKQRGLTQKAMAEMIGIMPASLSAYMKGTKTPALDIAVKIANALGVSIGWLCGDLQGSSQMATYEDLLRNLVAMVDTSGVNFVIRGDFAPLDSHGFFAGNTAEILMYKQEAEEHGEDPDSVGYAALESIDIYLMGFLSDWQRIRDLYLNGTIDAEMYEAWLEKRFKLHANDTLPGYRTAENQP